MEEHKKDLEKRTISKKNDGWSVFALTNITEGCDFVSNLLQRYLDDLRIRSRDEEFDSLPSVLLRKSIKLKTIDDIIDDLSEKTITLKNEAEAHAKRIAEELRLKEIADNIRRLEKRRLEFNHRSAYKRQHSYKGRLRVPLIYPDEKEDYKEQLDLLEQRTKSPKIVRNDKLRHL